MLLKGRGGSGKSTGPAYEQINPSKYFNKYRILLGSNRKIKQITLSKCPKCTNPGLRQFLTCTCGRAAATDVSGRTSVNRSALVSAATSYSAATNKTVRFERSVASAGTNSVFNESVATSASYEMPTSGLYNPEIGLKRQKHSVVNEDFNKSLLNIIVQNRLHGNLPMEDIDEMIKSRQIVTDNWATPFDHVESMLPVVDKQMMPAVDSAPQPPPPSQLRKTSATSRSTDSTADCSESGVLTMSMSLSKSTASTGMIASFLQKRRMTRYELTTSGSRPTSSDSGATRSREELSFTDLKDLESQCVTRNEPAKLLSRLRDTKVLKTSNPHFANVDRYDVHENYKKAKISADITELVERNRVILEKIQREQAVSARAAKRFLSPKRVSFSSSVHSKTTFGNTI
jgi:hypothetical protein